MLSLKDGENVGKFGRTTNKKVGAKNFSPLLLSTTVDLLFYNDEFRSTVQLMSFFLFIPLRHAVDLSI